MDKLVDHLFIFEGGGMIRDFPGNYTQYRIWQKEQETPKQPSTPEPVSTQHKQAEGKRKPSFKEKREFEMLSKEIADLNEEKAQVTTRLNSGAAGFEELQELSQRIVELTNLIDEKELRWLELSEFVD